LIQIRGAASCPGFPIAHDRPIPPIMHLEKVTSRSSEATLAGWISSNDVTLFTTVLVLVIAIFLHTKVDKGTKANRRLTEANTALAGSLEAIAKQRDTSSNLLDETRKSLSQTESDRDRLQQQLAEKLADMSRLNAKLDLLLNEKGELESQRQSLTEVKESLTSTRDALKTENTDLTKRLQSITGQLEEKVAALAQVEQHRDRLKKQADKLETIVANLESRVKALNLDVTKVQTAAAAARDESLTKAQKLETQLAASDKLADEYLAKLKRATEAFQGLQAEKQQLQLTISESELRHQAQLLEEGRHNRELIGLTGQLDRVAILLDASGSMKQAAASGGDRWAESQQIAANWLQHLNVQHCALIVFSSAVRTFPEDGTLADLRGEDGKARRSALLEHVKTLTPAGTTNTLDALRKAYEYDVNAILLFSDGAPSRSDSGTFDPAVAKQIYDLCRAHPRIPVHTIGLGNYFDKNASTFLRTVAATTGGTFRGQ
jgi:uncharacterized coiled-coil DUF342 family protein